jgi:hypothetical protein
MSNHPKNGSWTQIFADKTRHSGGKNLHHKGEYFFSIKRVFLSVFIRIYQILSASECSFQDHDSSAIKQGKSASMIFSTPCGSNMVF